MDIIEKTGPMDGSRPIKVVIGDFDDNMGQIICDSLSEDSNGGSLVIETTVTKRSDELIEVVQKGDFDLALLILNNMRFDPDVQDWLEPAMTYISELKHRYGLPVIALYGSPKDESFAGQIMEKGANFASLVPCEWNDIVSAFCNCVNRFPEATNKVTPDFDPRLSN